MLICGEDLAVQLTGAGQGVLSPWFSAFSGVKQLTCVSGYKWSGYKMSGYKRSGYKLSGYKRSGH